MKTEVRQWSIVWALAKGMEYKPVNLAEEFGVSVGVINRDIRTLIDSGFPLFFKGEFGDEGNTVVGMDANWMSKCPGPKDIGYGVVVNKLTATARLRV